MEKYIEIGGRLHSTATGNVTTGANEILDDELNKKQSQINSETLQHVESIDAALQELSPDQTQALALATDVNTLKAKSVRGDETQSLTDVEKEQAISNMGVTGVYDISGEHPVSGHPKKYSTLPAALADVPVGRRKSGMSVKALMQLTQEMYHVEVTEGVTDLPTGYNEYELSEASPMTTGDYTYSELDTENFGAIPSTVGASVLYYIYDSQSSSYTTWLLTKSSDSTYAYKQYLYMQEYANTTAGNTAFLTAANWQGVDDEPTAGSDNLVKSGGVWKELALGAVYDVSAKNPTAGPNNDGKFESLSALLSDANLNTLIPTAVRKGGMSIKFVQSSDNKYVQYMLTSDTFTTNVSNWEECNSNTVEGKAFYVTDSNGYTIAKIDKDGVHSVDFKIGAEGDSVKRQLEGISSSDILFGKKICCCGDSITYGADIDSEGIAQESSIDVYQSDANGNFTKVSTNFRKTYGYQIAARHNMTFYNAGVSGSTMQGLSDKHGFSLVDGRYTKLPSDADIITIFFGWNDNAYGTLGTIDDTTNESYYGGYNIVLPYLLEHHPYAKIILIVPYGCTEGHRDAIRLLANKWGVACFDMYQGGTPLYYGKEDYVGVESDVVSANRTKYQAIGAHPNYKGHTAIGDMLESYLLTGVVNVDGKIKQSENKTAELIAEEEERAKSEENKKLNFSISDDTFYFTDNNGYIIAKIDKDGIHSVNIDEHPNTINDTKLEITDSNGYIIAKIDKDGIHSAKDKHAVACMVLSESYYPTAAPTRDSDGNITYVEVMFETGIAGSISITYTNGNSSSVAVVYGNYNYTITINRDTDGNVETVNVQ